MRIQHNIMAMNAYRNYTNNVSAMKKNLEKLSSGYKINRAGDDAAGLAISEKMRAQITGLQTAQKNAKDGISLVQTAEGALTEVHDMLNRMVELATQSANGTYDNTDRTQLQKEVNQLLEEIDRIADSSNFNGINLLDGTLGLNTDAFTVGESVAASDLIEGDVIATGAATVAAATASDTHVSDLQSLVPPSFSIDVADYALKTGAASAGTLKVEIGSGAGKVTINATFASGASYDAKTIATTLITAFNTGANGVEGAATTTKAQGKIGDLAFKAELASDNHTINFTYVGVLNDNGTKVDADAKFTDTLASDFNSLIGGEVSATASKASESGRFDCDILNPVEAVAPGDTQRAGITYTLGSAAIADGNKITIDGKTFTIKTAGSESVVASDASNVIDVSKYDADDQMRQVVIQLANETTDNFIIHTKDADAGEIHLEQKISSYANGTASTSELYDYDRLSKLVEVKGPDTAAKTAGTKLTVVDAKIKDGNVISVGTDKFTAGKDYTDAASLKTAIEAKGYTVDSATDDDGNTVLTIHAKATTDGTTPAAPKILGKGLTLQIGDTSDDFNQLNVAVQDMHAASLGLKELKIDTEEAAQAAIKTIKDAINTVSDVRGTLGATQNRLDHTINNLSVMTENIQDAESTIRDTDVAEEMMAYTKNNILIQSAQAMLAQANQVPQGVLQLLG